MFILDPDLDFYPSRIQGFKKAPDPGSGSATLLSTIVYGKKDAFRRIKSMNKMTRKHA
jgi:hypothetical protein